MIEIHVPDALVESQHLYAGEAGRAFIAGLPDLAARTLERWELTPVGGSMHGMAALVLPVERADGSPAVVKFQVLDEETEGEPVALRVWDGDGAVRLLDHDATTGTMLLERAGDGQELTRSAEAGRDAARRGVVVLAELLARLTAGPAPAGMRTLGDIAGQMLDDTPAALKEIADPAERALVARCADAVREVVGEPGDRMLHWDLHFDNVLAAEREPWLAIDPKPLAGDPGFDLWPGLNNLFDPDDVRWRFDAMTEVLGLERGRALAWTLGRVLQNVLWEVEDGRALPAEDLELARRLLGRPL
ncbi:aminoglycoside phosphotransferase family protein [Streptomyces spectabilis]|uniref:Hydroxyurea phosphotransferase n=1 Tax=Streptomyces spectabilis TaxID=68270 RepID=A0A5P2X6U6_STRST|nr:aminoglycoside phosphotransferase family protein [Streptomyces spectabilis]MBB5106618.1 streptomycin 6-kinase [Streptomyces spectabilis]MCI3903525.1 aminoglycoside phosphotransferase family protein [Streptomyces spectabilis]QEV60723.1 hydroxyurea phosphotransferase [Streptomyces spectabilis]GGV48346.1 hydroxyurea phosphotransferase [Streptomyces spectabilis]